MPVGGGFRGVEVQHVVEVVVVRRRTRWRVGKPGAFRQGRVEQPRQAAGHDEGARRQRERVDERLAQVQFQALLRQEVRQRGRRPQVWVGPAVLPPHPGRRGLVARPAVGRQAMTVVVQHLIEEDARAGRADFAHIELVDVLRRLFRRQRGPDDLVGGAGHFIRERLLQAGADPGGIRGVIHAQLEFIGDAPRREGRREKPGRKRGVVGVQTGAAPVVHATVGISQNG